MFNTTLALNLAPKAICCSPICSNLAPCLRLSRHLFSASPITMAKTSWFFLEIVEVVWWLSKVARLSLMTQSQTFCLSWRPGFKLSHIHLEAFAKCNLITRLCPMEGSTWGRLPWLCNDVPNCTSRLNMLESQSIFLYRAVFPGASRKSDWHTSCQRFGAYWVPYPHLILCQICNDHEQTHMPPDVFENNNLGSIFILANNMSAGLILIETDCYLVWILRAPHNLSEPAIQIQLGFE